MASRLKKLHKCTDSRSCHRERHAAQITTKQTTKQDLLISVMTDQVPRYSLMVIICTAMILWDQNPTMAQVPSVNAFYRDMTSRRQSINDVCMMGAQWNHATGGSFYSYLNQRIQESWQRKDAVMVNRYKAEGLVARRYCNVF